MKGLFKMRDLCDMKRSQLTTPAHPMIADTTFMSRSGAVGFLEDQWFYHKH